MNNDRYIGTGQILIGLLVTVLVLIACTTVPQQELGTYGEPPTTESSSQDGQLEEIVVTASREADASPTSRAVRPAMAARARQPMLMASRAAGLESEIPALSSPDEELWIIAWPAAGEEGDNEDSSPGSGAMVAHFPVDDEAIAPREVPLPLKHTAVDAVIDGYISTVDVTQQFHNPFSEKIEAVYLFPLPEKSAVSEFIMTIGERRIRGILREKEEAKEIYAQARAQGLQASLLVQHRPNIFEQKVANIEPGKAIDVNIRYFHTLAYNDGWYSFVFPTVVGPRYNPPGHDDPIVPVPRGTAEEPSTHVQYLRPDERSGHDLSISVRINAGVEIETVKSTHEIVAEDRSDESKLVALANRSMIPNRDFILDFQVAGETIKSNLVTWTNPETQQGYFTLMMYPPAEAASLERRPMEMVFVLDSSGSMHGTPIDQAKGAIRTALDHLQEGDTFQIIRFSDNASAFGPEPVPATRENLRRAKSYLRSLNGSGGTQMIEGIKAALDFPHDPSRLRFVSFVTDGYIGNEPDIISAVHDRIGASRIFSFGVGSSVNRYLLERMAKEGRGAVAYLGPNDSASDIMSAFFGRISHPAMTDVEIKWGSMAVTDVYPNKLPDMFVGRPLVVTGKYVGTPGEIRVSGLAGNQRVQQRISGANSAADNPNVARIWARLRIADLADRRAWQYDPANELGTEILNTALQFQLMSDYTAFVAVDTSRTTEGDHGTTVHQAVPVPEGVRYETTVNQRRN